MEDVDTILGFPPPAPPISALTQSRPKLSPPIHLPLLPRDPHRAHLPHQESDKPLERGGLPHQRAQLSCGFFGGGSEGVGEEDDDCVDSGGLSCGVRVRVESDARRPSQRVIRGAQVQRSSSLSGEEPWRH